MEGRALFPVLSTGHAGEPGDEKGTLGLMGLASRCPFSCRKLSNSYPLRGNHLGGVSMPDKKLPHDVGPSVAVLQFASDGGSSLYQVQVNGRPDTELHMSPYDDQSAMVRLISSIPGGAALDGVLIRIVGDGWVAEAHRRVGEMLIKFYPGAIVTWFTKGSGEKGGE